MKDSIEVLNNHKIPSLLELKKKEVPEDWNLWTEWTKKHTGCERRCRKCKNADDKNCRGPDAQTRMKYEREPMVVEEEDEWIFPYTPPGDISILSSIIESKSLILVIMGTSNKKI